jgi:hypothetical protein
MSYKLELYTDPFGPAVKVWRRLSGLAGALRSSQPRPCHYSHLVVNSAGEIFPCARVWGRALNKKSFMRIARASDPDIASRVRNWSPPPCACARARLRRGLPGEHSRLGVLTAELSLACDAACLMCNTSSPGWKGSYGGYDMVEKLVAELSPQVLAVQGGEITAQPESLRWLERVKTSYPRTRLAVITNGWAPPSEHARLAELFDYFIVSFPAFQPDTYRAVTGGDPELPMAFSAAMIAAGRKVGLKYLATPVSLHELAAFTESAVGLKPHCLQVEALNLAEYFMGTPDRFCEKYIVSSLGDFHAALRAAAPAMRRDDIGLVLPEDLGGTAALCAGLGLRAEWDLDGLRPF